MIETLDDIRADIASRLADAAANRRNPLHTPIVATSDTDARVMVVRAFDAGSWTLRFHTDVRSPKVVVIESNPAVGIVGYDRGEKLQLRLRGTASIERSTPLVDSAWANSDNFARRCYLGEGPGAVSDVPTSGLPKRFEGVEPTDEELLPARTNFAILLVRIERADWFSLAHTGHRRAVFDLADGGGGRWVSP
ncbi:3-hydroxyisobutyrate dehydrogenase [Alteripontixanthobacter maritimus]|uniref:3-hydroxyisobutyrate dehydrogenase n=1 Tax=Alteripontixanthobacter maritimus TaxID=2161824 RepID=A0A369QAY4_9SPHN|nr:pyridoxamine 5'-phosphate oxidase family protein [Alteripontixanthobacter maritimus]RDC60387.1 3-hydroxyisobutyrate dehydrogenase [Alteripontixanthobacter maritimus]